MIQSENVKQDEKQKKEKRTIIIKYDISSKALLYLVVCLGIVFFTSMILV